MGAEIDRLEVKVEAQARGANAQLDRLVSNLDRVSNALTRINGSGIIGLANGVSRLSRAMQGMNSVKTADFSRLARNIEKLGTVNTSNLNSSASAMRNFVSSMNGIDKVSGNATRIGELAKGISKLGNKSTQSAITSIPQLTVALKEMMTTLSSSPTVSSNIINMTNAMANLAKQGQKVSSATKGIQGSIGSVGSSSANITSAISSISTSGGIGSFIGSTSGLLNMIPTVGPVLSQITQVASPLITTFENIAKKTITCAKNFFSFGMAGKSLSQIIGTLYQKYFMLFRASKWVAKGVTSAMDYIEEFNYFDVAMDKVSAENKSQWKEMGYDSAEEYADSFRTRLTNLTSKMTGYKVSDDGNLTETMGKNLGLDITQITNYQASMMQLTNSMGLTGEVSVNTSKALSMLAGDLSSIKNVDLATVMNDLQSGIVGQSRAMRKYGSDITVAALQEEAYANNVSKSVSEMTQAEKVQLRLLVMLKSSKYAYGDLAKTINQPANQVRMLKNNMVALARTIGSLFLPIIQAVLPVINALVMSLRQLFSWIASLIGVDLSSATSAIGSDNSGVSDLVDDAEDATDGLNGAADAAKKLKGQLQGFDELNVISTKDDSDSGSGGGSGSGAGGGVDLSGAISDALADYESIWDKMFEESEVRASRLSHDISLLMTRAWNESDFTPIGNIVATKIKDALDKIPWDEIQSVTGKISKSFAQCLNGIFATPGLGETIGKTIVELFNTALNVAWEFVTTFDFKKFGKFMADTLNGIIKNADMSKLADTISKIVIGLGDMAIGFLKNIDWDEMETKIGEFLDGLDWAGIVTTLLILLGELFKLKNKILGIVIRKILLDAVPEIMGVILALVIQGMAELAVRVIGSVSGLINSIIAQVGALTGAIVNLILTLPGRICGIITSIGQIISNFVTNVNSVIGGLDITSVFTNAKTTIVNTFNDIKTGIESVFSHIRLPSLKVTYDTNVSGLNKKIVQALGLAGWPKLSFYANGGFPEMGQMFVARENGPEMVGTMGGKSVVANNDQIVKGIASAVGPAVYNAMMSAMSSGGDNTTVINIDGKAVFQAVRNQDRTFRGTNGHSAFGY